MNKKKVVALIPTRLSSLRLPAKALLPITLQFQSYSFVNQRLSFRAF